MPVQLYSATIGGALSGMSAAIAAPNGAATTSAKVARSLFMVAPVFTYPDVGPRRRITRGGFYPKADVGLGQEVALHAHQAAPHALVGRRVETGCPVPGAAEVEEDP